MRKILFGTLVLFSQLAFSQGIKVISNEQIPLPESAKTCLPVLSAQGDFLLTTSDNMDGLQKYDLTTKELTTLTKDKGAGFGAQISSDGSTIVYRNREYKGRLRYTTLKSIDVESGKKTEIIKDTRDLEGTAVKEGTVFAINKGKSVSKRVSGPKLRSSAIPPVVSIKDGQLYMTEGSNTRLISPAGTNVSYLWASVSPDGSKLLYYVMGRSKAYVSDLDGKNAVSLGLLRAPKWLGNDWVVGMVDQDNGEIITSSVIVAVAANGKGRTELTDGSVIALTPTASADATRIVYNTADGKVFLMQVEITK